MKDCQGPWRSCSEAHCHSQPALTPPIFPPLATFGAGEASDFGVWSQLIIDNDHGADNSSFIGLPQGHVKVQIGGADMNVLRLRSRIQTNGLASL